MSAYKKSVGGEGEKSVTRLYRTDFDQAWQAVLEGLKSYPLDVTSRESGYVQTRWVENTQAKNFIDSFDPEDFFLKAELRYKVSVVKGVYLGSPAVRISVSKEQVIQRDVLDGRKWVESDSVDEKTFLYRVGRLIRLRTLLMQSEESRIQESLKGTEFDSQAQGLEEGIDAELDQAL